VRERPQGVEDVELAAVLSDQWALAGVALEYLPVGFGGYHWRATDRDAAQWFVTVTDLASMYGADLGPAMETAADLAAAGLDFVVAPVRTAAGPTVASLGSGYGVTLYPYAAGRPGEWGDVLGPGDRLAVVAMLAALHAVPAPALTPVRELRLARRDALADALTALDRPWSGGPFAEPARKLLAGRAGEVAGALDRFDDLARRVRSDGRPPVVTHGEPHAGNLLGDGAGFRLIDWDTVGLAPPERDLWDLVGADGGRAPDPVTTAYERLTGRAVNQEAVALYRLRWPLEELCLILAELRGPHGPGADTQTSFAALAESLDALGQDG
jgi:spectinomycin phosphotransferase